MTRAHEGWKKAGEEKADIPHPQENVGFLDSFPGTLIRKERSRSEFYGSKTLARRSLASVA